MKLETIALKGVLRFRDEVRLNLRDLPSGLIAFVGENGAGKTTMLEAPIAGNFRTFPSREKEVLDYVTATDGFIETTYELEGRGLFRSRLNLDGPHRRSEGVLTRILPDGTQAILNDGKVSTFDVEVGKLLPSLDLLLLSVFAAQNKKGTFSELDRKERRARFALLLGLEHLQEMAERAAAAAKLTQAEVDKLTALRDVLARDAGETVERDLEQRAQQLQAEGGRVEVQRVDLATTLAAVEAALAQLQDAASRHAAACAIADRLDVEIEAATAQHQATLDALHQHGDVSTIERAALTKAMETALKALQVEREHSQALADELARIVAARDAVLTDADERIANNQHRLEEREAIAAAVAAIDAADRDIAGLRIQINEALDRKDTLTRREEVQRNALHDVTLAEQQLAAAQRDAGLLATVPFGEACAPCQFMRNAAEAKAKLPNLVEACGSRATVEREIETIRAQRTEVDRVLSRLGLAVAERERTKAGYKPTADKAPTLATAAERIASHTQRKADAIADAERQTNAAHRREDARRRDLDTRIEGRRTEHAQHTAALERRLDARHDELMTTADTLATRLQRATLERANAEDVLAETAAASQQAAEQNIVLTLRRREWDASTTALATVQAQVADLQARRRAVAAKRTEWATVSARVEAFQTDVIEWTVLAKALGRDGLQTLEIDEAGPAVSKLTNDLLSSSYGSRFTVDLVTQEAKREKGKDGSTMKDVFEVKVYDARDGGEARDIADLSGGEKVIVEEALKSAIALLVNQRNPFPIRTCWRDETTGALNAENAMHYMTMLRRVHELGGFHQTIFITHNEDAALQADAQVYFADGQIDVRLPPYGASAERAA